jgi:hypothetical protein
VLVKQLQQADMCCGLLVIMHASDADAFFWVSLQPAAANCWCLHAATVLAHEFAPLLLLPPTIVSACILQNVVAVPVSSAAAHEAAYHGVPLTTLQDAAQV